MSREYYSVTQADLDFYKMYQRWYYCLGGCSYYSVEQDIDVGDLVKYNGDLAIVSGLSSLHRNLYVIRWEKQAKRYWCCGVRQSELKIVNKSDYIDTQKYKDLYSAYIDWLRKNDFQICTEHFRNNWNKYKSGEITEIESAYMAWKLARAGSNSIFQYAKKTYQNFFPRKAKKKEVIL